jgi:hypothetical protein
MWVHVLRTFVTHLLVHIPQKEEIPAKFASVNGPVYLPCFEIIMTVVMIYDL